MLKELIDYIKARCTDKNLFLTSAAIAVLGSFLLIEHEYNYGIDPVFGHEWVGIGLIAVSVIIGYVAKTKGVA